jgi:hypothetical protein
MVLYVVVEIVPETLEERDYDNIVTTGEVC